MNPDAAALMLAGSVNSDVDTETVVPVPLAETSGVYVNAVAKLIVCAVVDVFS